jgi:uncharacterized protein (DUF362 family)
MSNEVIFKRLESPSADSIRAAIENIIDRLRLNSELLGKRSLLKINAMSDELFPGRNTSPWVLDGALSVLQTRFPGTEFLIVDADVAGSRQFDRACEQWGYSAIARRRDARVVNLSESPVVTVPTSNPCCRALEFPKIVLEAGSIINLPVVKTHVLTGISCALKNHWGLLPRLRYQYHPFVNEVVAEINRQIKHTIATIADGTICIEGSGPKTGLPRVCNVLFAGRDRVAVDAAVLDFIGMDRALAPHVTKAEEYGIGRTVFEIVGDELVRMQFKLPKKSSDVVSQIESTLRKVPGLGPLLYRPRIARVLGYIGTEYNRRVWMTLFGKRHLARLERDPHYGPEFWPSPHEKLGLKQGKSPRRARRATSVTNCHEQSETANSSARLS